MSIYIEEIMFILIAPLCAFTLVQSTSNAMLSLLLRLGISIHSANLRL